MGLGLIALLVTAIGEYVEGLRQEALRKTQKLIDDAAKLSLELAKGGGKAGPTYEGAESQRTHNQHAKKKRGFGKMTIATKRAGRELDRASSAAGGQGQELSGGAAGGGRQGGKMEP